MIHHIRTLRPRSACLATLLLASAVNGAVAVAQLPIANPDGAVLVHTGLTYPQGASLENVDGIRLESNGAWSGDELDNVDLNSFLIEPVGIVPVKAEGEGEGGTEGEGEGGTEGEGEGAVEGEGEGNTEGAVEGDGEGVDEGEGEATSHSVDQDGNLVVSLSELLRVIQFFNSDGFHCADNPEDTEDGYVPRPGLNQTCARYDSDYNPQDWDINLSELLRSIQLYNSGGYTPCPDEDTEDGYCPNTP